MKTKTLMIIAIILTLGIGIAIGIGITNYNLNNNEEKNGDEIKENNNTSNEENEETTKYTKEDLETIIDEQLYALVNKKSLEELTNQERLRFLIKLYKKENPNYMNGEPFKAEELRKIHQTSVIKNLKIEYIDIYDYYSIFSSDVQGGREAGFKYDSDKDTYTYTGALGHGAVAIARVLYKELISFEENNNEYTIKYKYVFGNTSGDGPVPYTLYYSGIDAYNKENEFKVFSYGECAGDFCSDYQTPAINYIEENYDKIKEKLPVYTYVFKEENNQLVISSFNVE